MSPAFAASAGVWNAAEPSFAARKMTNLFEKSSPPLRTLIGGMITSFTSEVITEPKAAPIITPTARSTALPFTANSLNSFHAFLTQLISFLLLFVFFILSLGDYDVRELIRHDDHFQVRREGVANNALHLRTSLRCSFDVLSWRIHRHFDSIAQSAVYLNDDLNLVLDEQPFIVGWPGLFSDVAARIAEFRVQLFPKLGRNVRRKRIQQYQKGAHRRHGNRVNVGECIDENHHL